MGGRRSAKRINHSVAPLCGPRTHALVDRGMSQYWLVRSADFCRYGQASHSLLVPNPATIGEAPHRLTSVRGRRLGVPFGRQPRDSIPALVLAVITRERGCRGCTLRWRAIVEHAAQPPQVDLCGRRCRSGPSATLSIPLFVDNVGFHFAVALRTILIGSASM